MASTKAVHRSQFSGAQSRSREAGQWTWMSKRKMPGLVSLQKPRETTPRSVPSSPASQMTAFRLQTPRVYASATPTQQSTWQDRQLQERHSFVKYFKNKFTNVPINHLLSTDSMKDMIFHTLVVKVLVPFMLNSMGLLLRDVLIGFREAAAAAS